MQKRAQSAMEFLMTYGWAILVVLAAVAALAYFGVLSASKYVPEQCVLEAGVACIDFKILPSESILFISNSLGRDMKITNVAVGDCNNTISIDLDNGNSVQINLTSCNNGASGTAFRKPVLIDYINKDSGMSKQITGKISAKVQ